MGPSVRLNGRIRAREVRLIDSEGNQLGVKPLRDALALAQQSGLDLVEIAPNANPPVCKILQYGKFRYEQAKKDKESRKQQTASKIKQIKFHVNISEHDFQIKLHQIEQFLEKHMKCKVSLFFRGRELAHQDLGMQIMRRLGREVLRFGMVEAEPRVIGRGISMLISPMSGKKPVTAKNEPPPQPNGSSGRVMAVEVKGVVHAPEAAPARPASGINSIGAAFDRTQTNKG